MKEKEKAKFLALKIYSFTTDFWTSCQNCSYGIITIHYIDSDYVLSSHLLETKEITQAHTDMNIAEEIIRGIMDHYHLIMFQQQQLITLPIWCLP